MNDASIEIRAALATGANRDFEFHTLRLDQPRADEVLVRIMAVGLCHTDISCRDSNLPACPAVLGHEGAGIVERIGAQVTGVTVGDRVALSFRSCGQCTTCLAGQPAYCRSWFMLNFAGCRPDGSATLSDDGRPVAGSFFGQSSFATHALAYARNIVPIPDDLPFEHAAPLGCGVQTGAGAVMRSLACRPGSSLLVTGGGPVGLSAVMGGRLQGCATIILVEPHASRRALAIEFGATHVIDPAAAPDLAAAILALRPDGVDYALDTTGLPAVQTAAMAALAERGTLGIVGLSPPGTPIPGDITTIMMKGQSIRGIIEGDSDPHSFVPELIVHHRRGDLPFERMIRTYPFDQINEAVAAQARGECIKVVLLMDAPPGDEDYD
ncbi:MAG: NAD(P)-dependent alcohol dehydrogenase [Sphingomonadaceae bacterium]|nr:NAD(P)-dependent alcohol dehydrogenase [Sphingomonadaceae bacterium]